MKEPRHTVVYENLLLNIRATFSAAALFFSKCARLETTNYARGQGREGNYHWYDSGLKGTVQRDLSGVKSGINR
jgi:hypothetical protein